MSSSKTQIKNHRIKIRVPTAIYMPIGNGFVTSIVDFARYAAAFSIRFVSNKGGALHQ